MNETVLALFLFVAFGAFASLRFSWAVAAVLFLLPSYAIRLSVWSVPTTVLEVLLVALVVVWVIRVRGNAWRAMRASSWRWPVLALLAVATVAVFVSPDRTSAFGYWKAYFVEPLLMFFLLISTTRTARGLRLLLVALGSSVAVVALVSLLQSVDLLPSLAPWNAESPQRLTSVFAYPNAVGLFVAPLGAFFIGLALRAGKRSRAASLFLWGTVVASCLAASFAVSRGALVALVLAVFVGFLMTRWRAVALAAGALFVLAVLLVPSTRTMVTKVVTGADTSTDVRLALWQGTLNLIEARPLFGAGLGGFPLLYADYKLAKHTEFLQYPHNILLNIWVELGILGVLVSAWLGFAAFRSARALRTASSSLVRGVGLGVLLALIALLAQGLVDVPYFKNDLAVQSWALLAILVIAGRLGGRAGEESV